MFEKWRKLSAKERLKTQIIIACMICVVYGPVYFLARKNLMEAEKMLNRRRDRIEKRADMKSVESGGGLNPQVIAAKIEEAKKKLEESAESSGDLDYGFAPVDSDEARQEVMLEISSLAERTGVELLSVSRREKPAPKETGKKATAGAAPAEPPMPEAARPSLTIKANATFGATLEFLRGVKELSYYVSVMNLKLYAAPPGAERGRAHADDGVLYALMEVSI